jgi:hypothetical protein
MVDCWYVLTPHNRVGIAVQPAFSDDTNAEANARLIAAAPDMFEALVEARLALETLARRVFNDNGDHTIDTSPLNPDVYSACYYASRTVVAALAKARGEQVQS